MAYHFSSFSSSYGKFEVSIFLPIPEKKRESGQKTIVNASHIGNGFKTGTAIESAFSIFHTANKCLPCVKIIRIVFLSQVSTCIKRWIIMTYHLAI